MKKTMVVLAVVLLVFGTVNANNLSNITTVSTGVCPRGIAIGDLIANGKNQVIVANFGAGTLIGQDTSNTPNSSVSIFSNTNALSIPVQTGKSPRGVAIWNGMLVISNYDDGTLMVYTNENGTPVLKDTIAVGKHPVGVAIGDLDNNGQPDIACAVYNDSKVVVIMNELTKNTQKLEIPVPGNPTDVAMGKIGNENVVVSANYNSANVSVIKLAATGLVKEKDIATGSGPCKVAIANVMNNDSNDIITANFYDNTVSILEGPNLTLTTTVKLAGLRPNGMCVADVTGGGKNEIITADRDSDSIDIIMQKDNVFQVVKSYKVTDDKDQTFGPVEVTAGDVNGDGLNDIVFTHMRTNTVRVIYQEPPAAPVVSSSSHPEQSMWYADNSPVIHMQAQDDLNGIAGYMYCVSKNSGAFSADKAVFSASPDIKLSGLETGPWVFTAAVKDSAGNVGKQSVYKINITEEMSEKNVYNYPNPCKGTTTIRFPLVTAQDIKIIITDINARTVWHKDLSAADVIAGVNAIQWNCVNDSGANVANGVYILRVASKTKTVTKKISVVK